MPRVPRLLRHAWPVAATLLTLVVDAGRFFRLWLRSPAPLAAENLFLRKQLALYQEHHVTPRRATNATRIGVPAPVVGLRLHEGLLPVWLHNAAGELRPTATKTRNDQRSALWAVCSAG